MFCWRGVTPNVIPDSILTPSLRVRIHRPRHAEETSTHDQPDPRPTPRATEITHEIATLGFALPGSVALRYTTCGTPGCRCHADPPRPHGPYTSWTRKVAGKTITRRLSAEQHAQYEPWFQAHRRLRELLGELETLSLEIIENELRPATGPKRKTPAT